ncbi:MAG: diaminopimelate epimerase [Gammaproteobacteria bacterium]|nr:MAG: diaminopimelate epimerase [Gammaproteobacteria bacterium]
MPTTLHFTKMHGLGNDFVVMDPVTLSITDIAQLAHRHIGIGFDQLLVIEPSSRADFFCRIFNADGSEAEQCGNGLRCVARFVHEEKRHPASHLTIETKAGVFPILIKDYDHIRVTMGAPQLQENKLELMLTQQSVVMSVLSMGNPHAVMAVESVETVPISQLGPDIATHAFFPQGINVGFMQIITPHHIRLRTFERGAGETYACGSNACAAVAAGIAHGWLKSHVQVEFQHGSLHIEWEGEGKPIHMTGPATKVFDGVVTL